jgi:hypothetical protein
MASPLIARGIPCIICAIILAHTPATALEMAPKSEASAEDKDREQPLSAEQQKILDQSVSRLSDDDFQTRELATQALVKLPRAATEALKKYLETATDAEAKSRLKTVIDALHRCNAADITDADREASAGRIADYMNKLSILQTLKVGDHIEGAIMLRNTGEKRIELLELTLCASVNGREKPEQFRLVFANKKDLVSPPQPSRKGGEGAALMRVKIPSPAGGVKGAPELKLTYLQFEK